MDVETKQEPIQTGLSLSAKLALGYALIILVVAGTFTLGLYFQLRSAQRQAFQERLHDIVSFAAPLVDGDYHSLIHSPQDESSSFYRYIALRLQSIEDTSDVITRIYTLRQREDGRLVYVVDVDPQSPAHVGQLYERTSPLLELGLNAFPGPVVEDDLYQDDDGTHLSGYAPIYDQFQELDGVLGIDIDAATVMVSEARARRTALLAFLVAIPFSILTGWWLSNRLTAPVTDLVHGVERVAQGVLDAPIPVHSRDELGVLATAFNQMTVRLKQTLGGLEQEITERVQIQAALQRRHRELTLLNRVIAAASTTLEPNQVLETICRELALAFDVPQAAAAILNDQQTASVVVAEFLAEGYPSALDIVISLEGNPATQYVVDHKTPLAVVDAQHDPRMATIHDLMRRRGTVSLLILPLIVRGRVVGTLGLDAVERREFSQDEINLAASAVSAAAQVLENAGLFEAEHRARQVAEVLGAIARELNTVQDLNTALDLVLANIGRVITSDSSAVLLRQHAQMTIMAVRGFSAPQDVLNKKLDLDVALLNREVIETRQPLIVPSVSNDPRWLQSLQASGLTPDLSKIQSWLGVPLVAQERVIGMLTLDKVEPDYYTQEDAELALIFASHAAIAIEKTRLFNEIMARNEELLNIYQASQRLQRTHTPENLAREIITTIQQTLRCQYAAVLLIDQTTGLLTPFVLSDQGIGAASMEEDKAYVAAHNIRLGEGITGWVAQSGESVRLGNVRQEPRYYSLRPEVLSELCVPLKVQDQIIGVVNVEANRLDAYHESDQHLLETLASQIAISIQNAQLQNETQRRLAYLQALHKIDEAISGSLDLRLMLRVLLDQVVNQLKVDAADILLLRKETQDLEFAAGFGFRMNYNPPVQRINQSPAGNAVLERRIVHIANLKKRVTGFLLSPALRGEGFASYYGVPLIAKGQVLGVLEIFNRAQLGSEPEWLDFLVTIAGQAAIAIENATMFDDLQRSNLAIRLAYENTLEGWARTLELRDMETEGHSRRVVDQTMELAQRMNLRGADLTQVRWGALLHDIGKMGIPDSILQKAGTLTPEEWVLMRKHPSFAYELLYPVEYLRTALDIPYCHHERWDGSGYPRGLKGERIPLAARIFAVVDVWDALTSDRPYREAWSPEQAAAYLRENAGTHFDPKVVKAFFDAGMEKG